MTDTKEPSNKITNEPVKFVVYVDGSSRGNPGPAGVGVAIFTDQDKQKPQHEISKYIGITTNNVAEYEAVIHALKWIIMAKIEKVTIRLDSELVYYQIMGKYRVKSPRTTIMLKRINGLKPQIKNLSFFLVSRDQNKAANRLAQRASKAHKITKNLFQQQTI